MKLLPLLLLFFGVCFVRAQLVMELEAEKQGFKNGVHWVKRTWYLPLKGKAEPDKSKVPDIYMRPNQLIEFSEQGKLRSVMDYERGSDEKSGPTRRWFWKDGKLVKEEQENTAYEAVTTTLHQYDAAGNEVKRETKAGPGDKTGIFAGMATTEENTWTGGKLASTTTRGRDGKVKQKTTYTYDAAGRKTKEEYSPAGLYSARTFEYDASGHVVKDTYLDKAGAPSTVWTFENNKAGKPLKRVMSHFYQGKKDSEEVTTFTYSPQGDMTSQKTEKDGKVTYDYRWEHKYDDKGNRIQTAHIKAGKPEHIEVLELRYY
jgi:YD repeat-containing protein